MEKEKCDCGNIAVWVYMPGFGKDEFGNRINSFICDDCVHRGCSCNNHWVDPNGYHPPLDEPDLPTEKDEPYIWLEEGVEWTHVDEKGRQYPCCEYMYSENGFNRESDS